MSLFGSFMADVEDDPFFGTHMRHMRHMNNMMNSLLSDPFGMFGGASPLAIGGPRHGGALMPYMPQMPSLNRLYSLDMDGHMNAASSYSSTVVMSSGPHGKPQVFTSSQSTKIGPNGVKETRKTLEDSRSGTKKMSIGHHIGDRAHVIEREQNYYSGEREERQEFINLEEEEAEDFDREFQQASGGYSSPRPRPALPAPPAPPRLALPPATSTYTPHTAPSDEVPVRSRPSARRPLRVRVSPLAARDLTSASVREVYSGSHPLPHRHKHRSHKHNTHNDN